ncbi:MAG: PD-(D/E)XK nuclease family protein [Gallionellaceae bacterium]|nr:PD-(D/E)XK nuclease family protein [Gallionellaceae bacterium]
MDTSFAAAARVFLEHEGGRFPDFSACLILTPHHHAGLAFRRALHEALPGKALLPPRLLTLPELAAGAPGNGSPEPDSLRLAELQHFLARTDQVPRAALWPAARELLSLLNELDEQGLDLPEAAASENRHLGVEAGITQAVWRALCGSGAKSRTRDYGERLAYLAANCETPLYTLGLAGLSCLERAFLETWAGRQPVLDLPVPPRFPERQALLAAVWDVETPELARRGADFAALHPDNPLRDAVELLAAPSLEAAARVAENTLLDWLREGRRDIAIVALDRLAARRLRALLERRRILIQDETGWAFSTASASHVLDRWLNVVMDDAWFRDLLDFIKSPFVLTDAQGARLAAANSLEQAWRRHGAPQGLAGHLALARQEGLGAAVRILTRIEHARGLFPDVRLPLSDWTRRLLEAFDRLAATPALRADPVGNQLLAMLAGLAQDTAHHEQRFALAEWRRWLYLHLEQATFADTRVQSPIRLTHPNAARLRDLDGLLLLGVDAGHLPGKSPAGLFNDATRVQLGLPGAAEREADSRAALADALARCERVALIWQNAEAGEEKPLSPWLLRLEVFQRAGWGTDWSKQRNPGEFAQDARIPLPSIQATREASAPTADAPPERISVSAWQSLVSCPYQFFARHLLGLGELDEVPEEMDKADYGSLVHKVLADFHSRRPLLAGNEAGELEADLLATSERIFAPSEARGYLAGAWRLRWQRHIPAYLDWALQREADGYHFAKAEEKLSRLIEWSPEQGTRLEGRADRLDQGTDGAALLDYKTQSKQTLRHKLDENAEDVQLTAYAWITGAAEAGFVTLDDDKVETLLWKGDLAEAAAAEGERLTHVFAALAAGAPLPANAAPKTCEWCEMRGLCRREHDAKR